jgi:hypothetical protein
MVAAGNASADPSALQYARIVDSAEELPRTATGKIPHVALRSWSAPRKRPKRRAAQLEPVKEIIVLAARARHGQSGLRP